MILQRKIATFGFLSIAVIEYKKIKEGFFFQNCRHSHKSPAFVPINALQQEAPDV